MRGRVEKTNEPLQGVKCIVSNCYYNQSGDYCKAAEIEIKPKQARDSQETDCSTFVQN